MGTRKHDDDSNKHGASKDDDDNDDDSEEHGASKGWQLIARGDSHHSSRLHLQLCSDVNSVNWL